MKFYMSELPSHQHLSFIHQLIFKLEYYDDFDENEAIRYAIKKPKYFIQDVTGTLHNCKLDTDDDVVDHVISLFEKR